MQSSEKTRSKAIREIAEKVKKVFEGEGTGHDWWHIERVRKLAMKIAQSEEVDPVIVELGALLHDLADHKLHGGNVEAGIEKGKKWLIEGGFSEQVCNEVLDIMKHISYKGAEVSDHPLSRSGEVVRDADRLDAMGAIGIARTFAYGGNRNRLLYDPAIPSEKHDSFENYKTSSAPTINHFYEKLLLLKDRMHTETGRKIAIARHKYMEEFLAQFYCEWEGKC